MEVRSAWKSGGEFLPNFFASAAAAQPAKMFQPLEAGLLAADGLEVDGLVSLLISFADRDVDFHLHAIIVEKRPSGLLLEFLVEEKERLEWVLACARGESLPYLKRRHERVPCEVAAEVRTPGGGVLVGVTTNINEGGAHVALDQLPSSEEELVVVLRLTDEPEEFVARVVDVIDAGPQRGVALEFQFKSSEQRERLARTIAALKQ